MKKLFCILLLGVGLVGCQSNEEKATLLLDQAEASFANGHLNQAKMEIDSLRNTYKTEFDVIRQGQQLMRKIELQEHQRTLTFADSLLVERRQQADSLFQYFTFYKEEGIEDMGHYAPKRLAIEKNVERNYIRAQVNEYGEIRLESVYYGPREIKHTGLKMELKDGTNAETLAIPYDGGRNYRFKEHGNFSEIVTYDEEAQNGMIDFVAHYSKERIKVRYTGGSSYIIYLDDVSKQAIKDAYALSNVLKDITRLQQEQKVAAGKASFLEHKIAQKEATLK